MRPCSTPSSSTTPSIDCRPPQAVEQWAAAAPENFLFAFKLGSFGSHRKKLRDAASWMPKHLDRAERLGDHLGPTLVQLPPRWRRNAARLDEFLATVPATMRWAVEVRDPSWLHDDTYEVLRRHNVALCIHDLLADHPFVLTADWTYVRFHGPNAIEQPYRGAYGARRLKPWAARLVERARGRPRRVLLLQQRLRRPRDHRRQCGCATAIA